MASRVTTRSKAPRRARAFQWLTEPKGIPESIEL
jgi:hypothetical protein